MAPQGHPLDSKPQGLQLKLMGAQKLLYPDHTLQSRMNVRYLSYLPTLPSAPLASPLLPSLKQR